MIHEPIGGPTAYGNIHLEEHFGLARRRDTRRDSEDEDRTECIGRTWGIMWAAT